MATPPASGGHPEESLAALPFNSGVELEAASQVQQQSEGALSVSFGSKRKRPPVWDYFAKEKAHGVWKAQCIWCMKYISGGTKAGPGTANLMQHLDNCIGVNCGGGKKQTSLSSGSGKRRKVSVESGVSDEQVARKALSSMFILQNYPLPNADLVDAFVDALQPFYEVVNQNTIREDILDLYEAGRKKVLNNLRKFLRVPCPGTSDVLCEALYKCLQSWDLDCKLSTLNLENYSANEDLIPLIKEKIGPVVKEGGEVIWADIVKIRDSVAYCLSTPKRYEMFEETAESQQICGIKFLMQKWLGCGDPVIEKMSAAMIENFDKYWSDIHELMALGIILDPRGKTGALHTVIGEENADYHVRKIVDLLRELVNEYKKVQTEEEGMATSSPSSFDACMEAEHAEWMEKELDHYLETERLDLWHITSIKHIKDLLFHPFTQNLPESFVEN
ncbi:zinc finger BED domain-containing protein RICESLEEPER 1-like [Setaria viridis]|uniref:zinc finger BED domain-containing protein RICESLEEPER 1-like n=1 Tax=Setaria viridis TaxID=4556 RepID=UPI003B3BD5B9